MNKIRKVREQLGYTQSQLAEKTNLSKRTIQRLESGNTIPKGHTLRVLSEVLGIEKTELQQQSPTPESENSEINLKLKWINLASLFFIGIPFGNLIIPIWIWSKHKANPIVDEVGRKIINFQIIWTLGICVLLILSPFLQDFFPNDFTLILNIGLVAVAINLFFIIKTAIQLSHQDYDILPMKVRFI